MTMLTGSIGTLAAGDAAGELLYGMLVVLLAAAATAINTKGGPSPYGAWLVAVVMAAMCVLCMLTAVFVITPYRTVSALARSDVFGTHRRR